MMIKDAPFVRIVQKLHPRNRLLRVWELQGGVSARMTALEIEEPGGQRLKLLVRQHGERDLRSNPHIARDEFRLLQFLQAAGLATPRPSFFDESGSLFATPYIVVAYIEGQTELTPAAGITLMSQFAAHLASIHAVENAPMHLSFLPDQRARYTRKLGMRPDRLDVSLDEERIRRVLEAAWPFGQPNSSTLLHGDFWPGNVLWLHGQITGIIDWEDAIIGDPLEDLANSRLEMLWTFGLEAMLLFTAEYQALMPLDYRNLPYWDLCAALRPALKLALWASNEETAEKMRAEHHLFITRAFTAIE